MRAVIGTSVDEAISWLRRGEPVALPTETVYGLASPLFSQETIHKIYELKQRPTDNPLIVHVSSLEQVSSIAFQTPLSVRLQKQFWPGPLTLILRKKPCVSDLVTAGQSSVAVRCPKASLFREVINILNEPLVAPSANKFQHISPTTAQHVLEDMGDVLAYILDGGPCQCGVESTILSLLDENKPTLLRFGPIAKEELETFLGQEIAVGSLLVQDKEVHLSPGLYKKHYSPKTPLYWVTSLNHYKPTDDLREIFSHNSAHIYLFPPDKHLQENEFVLSKNNQLKEVAANLFALLQKIDLMKFSSIWIEKAPAVGIGNAINDRLSRAAHFKLT